MSREAYSHPECVYKTCPNEIMCSSMPGCLYPNYNKKSEINVPAPPIQISPVEIAPKEEPQKKKHILKLDGLTPENRLALLRLSDAIFGGDAIYAYEIDLTNADEYIRNSFETLTVALLNAQLWLKQRDQCEAACTEFRTQLKEQH